MIWWLKLRGWTITTENADYLFMRNYNIPSPASFNYHNKPADLLENYNELLEQLVCESINKGDID